MSKERFDDYGDPVEHERYPKGDAERLLRFNITAKRIADLCNKDRQFFPWDSEIAYSTWHRALDGKPVWDQITHELHALYDSQVADPRSYLPASPTDDLFDWMKQIAGPTWWVKTLSLDMKANTLTAWMSRGGAKPDAMLALRERVDEWWGKVDAACLQADKMRAYHKMERREHAREKRSEWAPVYKTPDSFDSYFYTYVHEDGHTVDEARAHYVEIGDLGENHYLHLLDLGNPQPVADRNRRYQSPFHTKDKLAERFDELWARGLDEAMPREMPEGTDLSDSIREAQWPDRRYEEGPWDVNQALYKKWYRQRTSWSWDRELREKVEFNVEVIEVSDDRVTWREPTERQRKGWDNQGLEIAKYREEHWGDGPKNQYDQEVAEARNALRRAHNQVQNPGSKLTPEERYAGEVRAEEELRRALANY